MNPFPFQTEGAEFLAGNKTAMLADEMGLGKTVQAVLACDRIGAKTVNVICPAVARSVWAREFPKWSKIDRGVSRDATKALFQADVNIYSYDAFSRGSARLESADVLILDEAHYLTNWQSSRTKAILGKDGARTKAGRVWCLTGTPMRGDPSSLWPMLYTLAPWTIAKRDGLPMTYYEFVRRYCTGFQIGRGFKPTGGKNLDDLAKRISGWFLRRRTDDVLPQLPGLFFSDHELDIEPVDHGIDAEGRDGDALIKWIKELADTAEWRQKLAIKKAEAAVKVIAEELRDGQYHKIVVFGWHTKALHILREGLADFGVCFVDGSTLPGRRVEEEMKFQNDADKQVFIGNIVAAGVAITLTAANQIYFIELDWTPLNNAQAAMRTRRIGQTKPSFARVAISDDELDSKVMKVLRRKSADIAAVFGEGVETEMNRRVK